MSLFSPSVPAGRLQFFIVHVVLSGIMYLAAVQVLRLEFDPVTQEFSYRAAGLPIFGVLAVCTSILGVINVMRRLAHLKSSPWLAVLVFVPIVGAFFTLYLLLASPSHGGTTHTPYGKNPYDPDSYVRNPTKAERAAPQVSIGGKALLLPGEENWASKDEAA